MKSIAIISIFILGFLTLQAESGGDQELVKQLVVKSYVEGLINAKDFDSARAGIHQGFKILGNRGTEMTEKGLGAWIEARGKRLHLPPVTYKIPLIDIKRKAAVVRIDMVRGTLQATDYVFLYKFKEGWRIVSAIDDVLIKKGE